MSARAGSLGVAVALAAWAGVAAAEPPTVAAAREALWAGRLEEAERSFAALLEADGRNVDALLGLAQARRWSGRPLEARVPAARAAQLQPDRADAREELAWTWADAGLPARARAVFAGGLAAPSPALRARLDRLGSPAVTLTTVAYEDSNDAVRLATRAALTIPMRDARLSLVGGATRVSVGSEALERAVVGAGLALPLGRAELSGRWAVHRGRDEEPLHEGEVGLRVTLSDAARVAVFARRRPFVEVDSLATDAAAYHAAGPGGALDPVYVARRGVDELRASLQGVPVRGGYVYADARGFEISDHNQGWSVAAGAGLGLLRALGLRAPAELVLRWDSYFTGFAEPRPGYFSPGSLDGHSPGLELRARVGDAVQLSAEAGTTRSFVTSPGAGGWFGGAAVAVRAGALTLDLRAQLRNDPWYESRRAFVSVGGAL